MQNAPDFSEQDFNKAMCTTCLLTWHFAKCLDCKFHIPEPEIEFNPKTMTRGAIMYPTTGFVPTVSESELAANYEKTVRAMVAEYPANMYWRNLLNEIEQRNAAKNGVDTVDAVAWEDESDVSQYFNGIPAHASKTWRERHLNSGG
jgi:hypothetical protein